MTPLAPACYTRAASRGPRFIAGGIVNAPSDRAAGAMMPDGSMMGVGPLVITQAPWFT
ncbi:MAG TPA: hypothetical protein VGB86_01935 [Methylomirabilota bacterium]